MKTFLAYLPLFFFLTPDQSFSQYILNGTAAKVSCNCYTLTSQAESQSGSVWNSNKIDLNQSFDFHFNVFLGCLDSSGADGIVFILQPLSTSVGSIGEGMGFQGVSPSVGISLDTWQNPGRNDPWYDHISIQLNGVITHGNDLAGPIAASATSTNIEDCKWHVLQITWNASTKTLATYFDGQFRLQAQYDLVANVFNNDPMVYWGFSGGTGSGINLQQFCTSLNPVFGTGLEDSSTCLGQPVIFSDQSESFTSIQNFYWDFDDGTTSTLKNPPPHNYNLPGAYVVKHVIKGMDGCISDTIKKIIDIGAKPVPDFSLSNTCTGKTIGITDQSTSFFGPVSGWNWLLDGTTAATTPQPAFSNLSPGGHQLQLAVRSVYGCMSDTIIKNFSVYPSPVVVIAANNGCSQQPISFSGRQIDNATTVSQWNWTFDNTLPVHDQDAVHVFSQGGVKTVHLTALAANGCVSNDTTKKIYIEDVHVNAGNDTSVQSNTSFMLHAGSQGDYNGPPALTWSPSAGLSSIYGFTPMANLQKDQVYCLTAITDAGCISKDSIKIKVFNAPGVLVPNAFTPNHDGLNDILRPRYNGIKHLDFFAVYNRWGQLIFKTSDMEKGWDGNVNGKLQNADTFVWIIGAEDFTGKAYQLRGIITIIK